MRLSANSKQRKNCQENWQKRLYDYKKVAKRIDISGLVQPLRRIRRLPFRKLNTSMKRREK